MSNQNKKFMRKSYLLGGALLAAALFVTTSCKEVMGSLDNPVSSYLEFKEAALYLAPDSVITPEISTISDGIKAFESDAPNVAKVDPVTGEITALTSGFTTIRATISNSKYYQDGKASIKVYVRVKNEAQFNADIERQKDNEEIKVLLADNAKFAIAGDEETGNIIVPAKKVTIEAPEAEPAIISLKGSFVISHAFTVENVRFDVTESTSQLIQLSQEEDVRSTLKTSKDVYTSSNQEDFCLIDSIKLKNVWVKNLKSDLISDRNTKWAPEKVIIKNCTVQANYTGNSTSVLWFASSSVHNLDVDGNIFYNIYNDKAKGTQRFISHVGSSTAIKVWGTTAKGDGTPDTEGSRIEWKFNNNTCIKVGYNKFGNNVPNSKNNMNMEGNNNIFYNVYKIYEFFTAQAVKETKDNIIWCPDLSGGVHSNDTSRTDSHGNKLATASDPGITVPTEPLDLVKGVKIK